MDLPLKRSSTSHTSAGYKKTKISECTKNSLIKLGINILSLVFDYLPQQEVMQNIAHISKYFLKASINSFKYRSNISLDLNLISFKLHRQYIRFTHLTNVVLSRNLESLMIKSRKYFKSAGKNIGLENVMEVIEKSENLKSLKSLKIDYKNYSISEIEDFLLKFESLRTLEISVNLKFPDLINFFTETYISKSICFTGIRLKYLSYNCLSEVSNHLGDILHLPLTHFSLQFTNCFLESIPLTSLSFISNTLKSLVLPPEFTFTYETSEVLCKFLRQSTTLETLSVSSTISKSLQNLVDSLSVNKTLKTLKLVGLRDLKVIDYELNSIDCIEILRSLKYSKVKDVTLFVCFSIYKTFYDEMDEEKIINNKLSKLMTALKETIEKNSNIKSLSIYLRSVPNFIIKRFCKSIIEYVKSGKVLNLFGYNFSNLIKGELTSLRIKKKHVIMNYHSNEFKIISTLFKLVADSLKTLESIVDSKVYRITLKIEDIRSKFVNEDEIIVQKCKSDFMNFIYILICCKSIENVYCTIGKNKDEIRGDNFCKVCQYTESYPNITLIKRII